jgi:thiamine-phosphate diphosphorylase
MIGKIKFEASLIGRIDIALASDADGVHLGSDDMSVTAARAILGPTKIIGYTVSSAETAIAAYKEGANYLGTEAVFETPTKKVIKKFSS